MDPAKGWDGWYIVRYGVGETLFKVGSVSIMYRDLLELKSK